jgi:hypothetical protein
VALPHLQGRALQAAGTACGHQAAAGLRAGTCTVPGLNAGAANVKKEQPMGNDRTSEATGETVASPDERLQRSIAVIGRQAVRIDSLEQENTELKQRIERAVLNIVCIGGPLNDNKLGYTKEQLVTFWRIKEELES